MSITINYIEDVAPFYGEVSSPYIVINQGVMRLFFSDEAYDRFLEGIA